MGEKSSAPSRPTATVPTMDIQERQARSLVVGEFGRASVENVARFAVPLFIVKAGRFSAVRPEQNQGLLLNGTAFFVNLGAGAFAVTANHVIEIALGEDVVLCGLFPIQYCPPASSLLKLDDLAGRMISRDIARDIATFRLSAEEVKQLGASVLTAPPVIPVQRIGGVAFAGFPGHQRTVVGLEQLRTGPEVTLSFAVFPGFGVAASVSESQVTFQFDFEHLVRTPGFDAPTPDFDLGGMSGGPFLTRVMTPGGIEYWAPAGVITQGRMLPEHHSGLLFAARLDCVRPDGRIE